MARLNKHEECIELFLKLFHKNLKSKRN
jgi:hypothetical protein